MNTEHITDAPLETQHLFWGTLLKSKRLRIYGGLLFILGTVVVCLKILFPPVSGETLHSDMTPLIQEEPGLSGMEDPSDTIAEESQELLPDNKTPERLNGPDRSKQENASEEHIRLPHDKDRGRSHPLQKHKTEQARNKIPAENKPDLPAPGQDIVEMSIYNQGITFLENGNPHAAVAAFRQTLSINPLNTKAYNSLGLALLSMGEDDAAEQAFQKALLIEPGYTKCLNNLALLYLKKKSPQRASDLLSRVVAEHPDDSEAWTNLGVAYRMQGELHPAEQAYSHALSLSPDEYRIHFNLAQTLEIQGKTIEAFDHYRKFLALAPASEAELARKVLERLMKLDSVYMGTGK